jgi:hypothetical protein
LFTREQVLRADFPPSDVIVHVNGRFERHGKMRALPDDPGAKYISNAADLGEIFPSIDWQSYVRLYNSLPGPNKVVTQHQDIQWLGIWNRLRNIPLTVSGDESYGGIPRDLNHISPCNRVEYRRTTNKKRSGVSRPVSVETGFQSFRLLYRPRQVEAMDDRFVELYPAGREVVNAFMASGKEILSREEMAAVLQSRKEFERYSMAPWDIFMFHLPRLRRTGFIEATYGGREKRRKCEVVPPTPPKPRFRNPIEELGATVVRPDKRRTDVGKRPAGGRSTVQPPGTPWAVRANDGHRASGLVAWRHRRVLDNITDRMDELRTAGESADADSRDGGVAVSDHPSPDGVGTGTEP